MIDGDRWAAFIAFIARAPAAEHPGVLFDGFRRDLVARGATAEQAEQEMRDVMAATRTRTDWAAPMFDRIYTSSEPLFNQRPNAFTARIAADRRPGRALDIAIGQGRNAVHLAAVRPTDPRSRAPGGPATPEWRQPGARVVASDRTLRSGGRSGAPGRA